MLLLSQGSLPLSFVFRYDFISTTVNRTYAVGNLTVHTDMGQHYGNNLFASPVFQQLKDDEIRKWNPQARNVTGTLDSCGWPADPQGAPSFTRRTTPFYEDFR